MSRTTVTIGGSIVLKEGHIYRLEYKIQSGNYRWMRYTATMTFLGMGGNGLSFNLRPLAGTQSLPLNCLLEVEDLGLTTGRSDSRHRSPKSLGPLKKNNDQGR